MKQLHFDSLIPLNFFDGVLPSDTPRNHPRLIREPLRGVPREKSWFFALPIVDKSIYLGNFNALSRYNYTVVYTLMRDENEFFHGSTPY